MFCRRTRRWFLGGILALRALLLDKVLPKEPQGTPSKCPQI